jgi:NAD(P)-dependent dehydrogenase (short-subunit alcohol dehydrogenase family)
MPEDWKGRTAIVTGAASGIGAAVGARICESGGRVLLVDRDAEGVQRVADELGDRAIGAVADTSSEIEVDAYTRLAVERFGRLDAVHNNAGIIGHLGAPVSEVTLQAFENTMAVNARGTFLGVRAAVRVMQEQGSGAIVNTSSAVGIMGGMGLAPYVMSKHAIVGLTRAVAMEFAGAGIRVNAICPGFIDTEMNREPERLVGEGDPAAGRDKLEAGLAVGRYGAPREVAAMVTWLLSDEASYVSGGVFPVDAGLTAGYDVHQQQDA